MRFPGDALIMGGALMFCVANAQAAPNFGAKASGSELFTPGIVRDGGPGSSSASIDEANFDADASFLPGATYLPELKAFSRNTTADNSDDITSSRAEAYQVFTSAVAQTIDLDISLHGIVVDDSTDVSFVLADVFVYGGTDFEVFESPICPDGRLGKFLFDGTYFCGSRLGWSNLFIPVGDVTFPDVLSFDVSAGGTFGVYAVLRANSSGGSADATQTLSLVFSDDDFLSAVEFPDSSPLLVDIDVKPGCLNINGHGVIPVAILGSDDVDVVQIDLATLAFGGLEVRTRGKKGPSCSLNFSDGDDLLDLICHFEDDVEKWVADGDEASLSGALIDGTPIGGVDSICLVPKRH